MFTPDSDRPLFITTTTKRQPVQCSIVAWIVLCRKVHPLFVRAGPTCLNRSAVCDDDDQAELVLLYCERLTFATGVLLNVILVAAAEFFEGEVLQCSRYVTLFLLVLVFLVL